MQVYKLTNLINGNIYIGQTVKTGKAFDEYWGSGKRIKYAIKKYGKENFQKDVLNKCTSKKQMDELEIFWIKHFRDMKYELYNLTEGGEGYLGPHAKEHNLKISLSKKGIKTSNGMLGKNHTKESNEKNRIAHLGKKQPIETIEKRIKSLKGKKRSEEFKKDRSNKMKGENNPTKKLETRLKIGKKLKGRIPWNKGKTKETDSRILSGKNHPRYRQYHTDETRLKMKKPHKIKPGQTSWSKGLTKYTDERLKLKAEKEKGRIPWNKNKNLNQTHRDNIGKNAKDEKYIYRDNVSKRIKKEEIFFYLNNGWKLGRLTYKKREE